MLEPAFPLRMLGFGLIYAWSTCLWDLVLPGTFANDQPLQSSVAWALSAAITDVYKRQILAIPASIGVHVLVLSQKT